MRIISCMLLLAAVSAEPAAQQEQPALSLGDAVDIIADYEVLHPRVPIATPWYGVTDFDNQTIYVIANSDRATRRKVVIHEMLHVVRRMRSEVLTSHDAEEAAVQAYSQTVYQQLFSN